MYLVYQTDNFFSLVLRSQPKSSADLIIVCLNAEQPLLLARSFFMFSYFFCECEPVEIPISDNDFEWYLVAESPPACPAQSMVFNEIEPVASSSVSLNAM